MAERMYLFTPSFISREESTPVNEENDWFSFRLVVAREVYVESVTLGRPVLLVLHCANAVIGARMQRLVQASPVLLLVSLERILARVAMRLYLLNPNVKLRGLLGNLGKNAFHDACF